MKLYWIQPGEINTISGGYIYNKNIIEGIRAESVNVELFIPGTDFPSPSKKSIEKCGDFFQNIKHSSVVIIDSLILGIIPELIEIFSAIHFIVGMIHLPLSLNPSFTKDERSYFIKNEMKSFEHSKLLIVTSEYTKSKIIKMGIDEAKIQVVTPGINSVVNQRSYPEKPGNLLCVSRISKSKGQLDLIKALENLRQFNWNLTFCGGFDEQDDYYKEIRKQISVSKMEGRISFTGEIPRSEIAKYYKQADLLILTSCFETYSMVLQEAMAFKLPIISANSGAVKQTVNLNVAKFYKPGDVMQLEKYLLLVISKSGEYKKLANEYGNKDIKFLNWTEKAGQFLKILEMYYAT